MSFQLGGQGDFDTDGAVQRAQSRQAVSRLYPLLVTALAVVVAQSIAGIYGLNGVFLVAGAAMSACPIVYLLKPILLRAAFVVSAVGFASSCLMYSSCPHKSSINEVMVDYFEKQNRDGGRSQYVNGMVQGVVSGPIERPQAGAVRLVVEGTVNDRFKGKVLLTGPDVPWNALSRIQEGDELRARVRIKPITPPTSFTGMSSYDGYLLRRGIISRGFISRVSWLNQHLAARSWREKFTLGLFSRYGDSDGLGVLLASTLGERAFVSDAVFRLFKETGTAHLIVVSGFHLAVIYAFNTAILGFLLARSLFCLLHVPIKSIAAVFGFVVCAGYTVLLGAELTLVRSLLVIGIFVVGEILGRKGSGVSNLFLAFIVVSLIWPGCVFEASCQLTFSALAGLLFAAHLIKQQPMMISSSKWIESVACTLLYNYWAWLFTAPIVLLWFNGLALGSAFINACLTALFSFPAICLGGSALVGYYFAIPGAEAVLSLSIAIIELIMRLLEWLHELFSSVGLGYYEVSVEDARSLGLFFVSLIGSRLSVELLRMRKFSCLW